jgi:Fic family protein
MSHIEISKRNGVEYASFVKKFTLMGREFRIHEHIGKNVSTLDKNNYLKRNLDRLSNKELELRRPLIEDLDLSYSDNLLFEVELLSIKINNLLEIKGIEDPIMIEFAKEFIFNSNNIEGSRIPAEEVKKIIETGDSRYDNYNEIKEVHNSIDAMRYIQNDFKFNTPSVKRLYHILTNGLMMQNGEKYPRGFKKVTNVVNNMETVPPELVEARLGRLNEAYRERKRVEHPLKLAFDHHLSYEEIHPFLDGNGRTGRLIMNKILMSNRYFPIIVYADNQTAYSNSISKALSMKGTKSYYQFMLKQAKKTYDSFHSMIEDF